MLCQWDYVHPSLATWVWAACASTGGRAPGYWLSPDHFQMVKRVLAPDWAQKMLCIIVPNRWTASPQFFLSVCTRRLLTWSWLFWLMHQRNTGSQETLHFKILSTQKLKTLFQKYKLELEKWIHIFSVSIVIIPTRLLCQMQANSSGAEFLSTISKFIKRRKFCHCLLTFFTKREIRHFSHGGSAVTAKKCAKKGDGGYTCKIVVLSCHAIAIFTFSLPLHLKPPIIYDTLWSVRNRIFSVQSLSFQSRTSIRAHKRIY